MTRGVAARGDIGDDRRDGSIDIGGGLALRGEQRGEDSRRNPRRDVSSLSGDIGRLAEALEPGSDLLRPRLQRGAVDDEARADLGDALDLDEAVGLQRRAGLHEIDDVATEAERSAPAPSRR